ncbi:hypothetical protein DXG01_001117 [Tephrocybe rancida]|nr:hypothetical protein DXG01_001117 [Tephrocybe rancida]
MPIILPALRHLLQHASRRLHLSSAYRSPFRSRNWSTLTSGPSSLTVHSLNIDFPYTWLRDSCQSPECVHPTTSQKLHRSSDIPRDIKPVEGGVRLSQDGIDIDWTDGHKSHFTASFLERHSSPSKLASFHQDVVNELWDKDIITQSRDLCIPYGSLQTPKGLLAALAQISRYGLLFVSDVPHQETADETCELSTLARIFGDIRTTFYGQLWDVLNVRNSKNIAYTNLDLGLHMDLLVQGGKSIFVDAIRSASMLRDTRPSAFDVLATMPVAFHYINDGHHFHHEHPTIELANPATGSPSGKIDYINYSPPFQAPLPLSTPDAFYPALRHFTELLNDPSNTYTYTLREGDAVLFDNRRVLHARTAFSDIEGQGAEGEANRWLKGCYLEADDLLDRRRILSE